MPHLIRLTDIEANPVVVNLNVVDRMYPREGRTDIYFSGNAGLSVTESIDEILRAEPIQLGS